jgi:phosphohistidine swiveling domain-containing protein
MERNFAYLEAELDRAGSSSLMELACLLEDSMDIHDRHWKIHWMLNFAQLSATIELRETMQRVRGSVDEQLLGRLQNSAADRNWDGVEALWQMKEEVKNDAGLTAAFRTSEAPGILSALNDSERGRRFLAERLAPYQNEFGWRAVWSHEFIFPTFRERPEPVLDQIRDYLESDYDYPAAVQAVRNDLEDASRELLDGLTGERRDELDRANRTSRKMAPLTPDHHFYIDQGANARMRLVLIAIGRHLVADGVLDQDDDVVFLRYNELRQLMGDPAGLDGRRVVSARRQERAAAYELRPRDWIGTVTDEHLAFPYLVNWGYPDRFYRGAAPEDGNIAGIGASPGTVEGVARVVLTVEDFDSVVSGDILVCQMTNPAWVVLFTKIAGLVTDTGGTTSHPAVLAREFSIPAVVGTSVATQKITTGDTIRVDGSLGVVEVVRPSAAAPEGPDFVRMAARPTANGRSA